MANRQLRGPPSLFPTPASPFAGPSTTNQPPSASHAPPPTSAQYPTINSTPTHTQLWLSSSHKLTQLESVTADESSVFGPAHAKALEDLRTAQIQLAQAWMRSECEDRDLLDGEHAELAKQSFGRDENLGGGGGSAGNSGGAGGTEDIAGKDAPGGEELPIPANAAMHGLGGFGGTSLGSGPGDGEMQRDMLLARKRRELNDAHFSRVSLSVMDVIQKLEHVAGQMGVVESESRDIWGGSEMSDGSSMK